ncbi:MAG: hypothetical protein JWP35_2489 [Caulobacter sp.]|nr:hypothetical protein [Caulobacter sp.]
MSVRSLAIALIVSAALNLFLLGAGVTAVVLGHGLKPPVASAAAQRAPLWRAGDELPPAHRQAWRDYLREHALSAAPVLRDARSGRRGAWEMLLKPTVDVAAAKAALAKARSGDEQARGIVEDAIVDFAATLPVDERMTLLEGLKRVAPQRAGIQAEKR